MGDVLLKVPDAIRFGGGEFIPEEGSDDKGLLKLNVTLDFGDFELEINPIFRTNNETLATAIVAGAEALEIEMGDGTINRKTVAKNVYDIGVKFAFSKLSK